MEGKVPLPLSQHQPPSELHPAGERELLIFREFGCRLSILTPRDVAPTLKSHGKLLDRYTEESFVRVQSHLEGQLSVQSKSEGIIKPHFVSV